MSASKVNQTSGRPPKLSVPHVEMVQRSFISWLSSLDEARKLKDLYPRG